MTSELTFLTDVTSVLCPTSSQRIKHNVTLSDSVLSRGKTTVVVVGAKILRVDATAAPFRWMDGLCEQNVWRIHMS